MNIWHARASRYSRVAVSRPQVMNIPVQSCNGSNGNRISLSFSFSLSFCLCFRLCLSFCSPAPTSQRKNMDSMDSSTVRCTRMVDSCISYTLESNSRSAAKTCFIHPWSSNTRPLELLSRNNSNVVGKYRKEEELHDEEYEPPTDLLGQGPEL